MRYLALGCVAVAGITAAIEDAFLFTVQGWLLTGVVFAILAVGSGWEVPLVRRGAQ